MKPLKTYGNRLSTGAGELLRTAATIAAIFGAIVGAFIFTMDPGQQENVLVAVSQDGEPGGDVPGRKAAKPDLRPSPVAIAGVLR